jgi:MraZ protein
MFLGEFSHTVDDKGRLTLPAKYRAELANGVVLTRGLDGCLFVFSTADWERVRQSLQHLPFTQKTARDFSRFIFAGASDLIPDRQGRILVPGYLREYAALDGEVTIIGSNDRLEIWNPQRWQEVITRVETEAETIAEHLLAPTSSVD